MCKVEILVIGGTGLVGSHITQSLLHSGHSVTIATRGNRIDNFDAQVSRVTLNRTNASSIAEALNGKVYDVIYDTQAYSSNEIKFLLDNAYCKRYIEVSTVSVYYPDLKLSLQVGDFDPYNYPLKWCNRNDFAYDEIKRQAECAIFQAYANIPSVAVRIPFVLGLDDNTRRLHFYVSNILAQKPININNLENRLAFISSSEAGKFMAWLADKDFCGPVNASSIGNISLAEIIAYVESKTGVNAIISTDGESAPYNSCPTFSLISDINKKVAWCCPNDFHRQDQTPNNVDAGATYYCPQISNFQQQCFVFSNIPDWIYNLLDEIIGEHYV